MVILILYAHALHSYFILTIFHVFRCVFDYCWKCPDRFRLGFYPWCNLSFARHMFMHTYPFIPFFGYDCVLFLSLSLSLSRIDCAMAPKTCKSTWDTYKSSFYDHVPLFTFGFMMGRPQRTSWKTSRNMAFIRSAMLFYQTLPTLLSLLSFKLGVENLYVRDPWGVPSCLYKM